LKALTALVSITTALVLIPRLPTLVTLPGIQVAYEKSERALAAVQVEKEEMQALYDAAGDREARVLALKEEVNALLQGQGKAPRYLQGEGY
ncbi:MAG: hypothetical protein KJO85_11270, partial [Gammaproteobacteria bacterium]|nr:hypothetical protein [Gammaproteobacteria bacterium]